MTVNPLPGTITAVLFATPNAPYATSAVLRKAPSATLRLVTAVPLAEAVWAIAPEPFAPTRLRPPTAAQIHRAIQIVVA